MEALFGRRPYGVNCSGVVTLIARLGDPTHLTVEELARVKRWPVIRVRRKIKQGEFTLEQIPGTKQFGVPIAEVYGDWIDVRKVRAAREREKNW